MFRCAGSVATAILLWMVLCAMPKPAHAAYGHSAVIQQNGYPVFEVDGKPFFVYGAAFFYERIPRALWRPSLVAYKRLGINTIDLYLIWNWHELEDGNFDFTGRTNERRNLHALFTLIHELGFKTIVRPGPVIRNEWRNGGYPSWLLERPDYNMPLHDILEGRYPATATLQNARSDDAAAEWMNNRTHMTYATRWLQRVLREIEPWSQDVIAIALDDDQGAYIDNQTYPAPHFQAYIKYLDSIVRGVTGPGVPTFINTYEMKVTASAPVWAWGNWYQSDAYSIGEHDRSQLEFSTGLLQTQPNLPVMVSEFQAGWLQGPGETSPRAADPSNTSLALGTLLQMGARGIVNFPVQDTMNPSGDEAPFANASYAWDAALSTTLQPQGRWAPTAYVGSLIKSYGARLAQTHRVSDAAILWKLGFASQVIAAQQWCRANALSCDLIDPAFSTVAATQRYHALIDPQHTTLDAALASKLRRESALPDGQSNLTLLAQDGNHFGFLIATNYETTPLELREVRVRLGYDRVLVAGGTVPARSIRLFPVRTAASKRSPSPGRGITAAPVQSASSATGQGTALAYSYDVFAEGSDAIVLDNSQVRIVVSPEAGARAFIFEDHATHRNIFTSIGAMRDDVANPLPPSPRDYIAKYTHQFAAGTFNRPYAAQILESGPHAVVRFSYKAPDLVAGHAVDFIRTLRLDPGARTFRMEMEPDRTVPRVTITSLTVGSPADFKNDVNQLGSFAQDAVGLYDVKTKELATISWRAGDLTGADFSMQAASALATLTVGAGGAPRITYGYFHADTLSAAQALLDSLKGR